MNQDLEHLKLLSIFHYIVAGLVALFACFFILYLVIGVIFLVAPERMANSGEVPPRFVGWIFIAVGTAVVIAGLAFAFCLFLAGRYLAQKKHYVFCLVMAALSCLFTPFGTILGIFTLVVLMRPSVKALFKSGGIQSSMPPPAPPQT